MKLIADSGATKTHWALIDDKKLIKEVYTPGFNPYYYESESFEESLKSELLSKVPVESVDQVYFYGSGISSEANQLIVENAIQSVIPGVGIETYHDLHGAAIALLGNESGIACILGTGSNSCLWDGQSVVTNVPSLGYFLGDEGSGTYIGKLFVRDVLIGDTDKEIADMFYAENGLNFASALDRIYKEPEPNLFLSGQTKLLRQNLDIPYCRQVIKRAFTDFVRVQLIKYPAYDSLPVCFVGSIAANFQDILEEVLTGYNIKMGKVMKEPMEGMIAYHIGG